MSQNNENQNNQQAVRDPYEKYKNAKVSPEDEVRNGPYEDDKRECRDICFCILFIAFLIAVIAVAYLGLFYGDPSKVLYPYDEDGKQCGRGEYKDFKYLYFYKYIDDGKDLINPTASTKIHTFCVKSCDPKSEPGGNYEMDCKHVTRSSDCIVQKDNYYEANEVMDRFCIPKSKEKTIPWQMGNDGKLYVTKEDYDNYLKEDADIISLSVVNTDKLVNWMGDLYKTWPIILASLVWSFLLGIIFMVLIRCCAGCIIYSAIIIILAALAAMGIFLFKQKDYYDSVDDSGYHNTFLALAWVSWILDLGFFIFIIFMCNKIRLAVNIMEITAKYIMQTCSILFLPILFFFITGAWFAFWIVVSVYLYSTGEFNKENTNIVAKIEWDNTTRYSWWFFLFALLYMAEMIKALSQFVYASSASIWYFNYGKETEERPIAKSFKRAFRFHWGSLAFGAFIIAVIRFLMLIIEYLKKQVDSAVGNKSKVGKIYKCLICICECCMKCVERCMEFINKHAYIEIALRGKNFCTSAWEGFGLIIRNLGRFSSLAFIGSFFNIFGILFISICSALIGFLVLTKIEYYEEKIASPILPVFCIFMIGIIISTVFMDIFGISSDSLMHCFLLDKEINGAAKGFPELQKFMEDEQD